MDGLDVMDAPDLEIEEGLEEVEDGLDTQEGETEGDETDSSAAPPPEAKEDPYTTKFSREMRAATKAWEQAHPEAAKFAKQARDNHARLFALTQIEPNGVNGVQEKYATLEALGGTEGLTGLQDRLAQAEETDRLLAAGNVKALDALGEDFNPGLAKLAPAILDRIQTSDPDAYARAVLPRFVEALRSSPLVEDFNKMVDILNTTDDPRLDEATKLKMMLGLVGRMAGWFNAQEQKAGQLKTASPAAGANDEIATQRSELEKERQNLHWSTHINPHTAKMESDKFSELFKPLQARLKLTDVQQKAALSDFKSKISAACKSDPNFQRQLNIYKNQKNPDPQTVRNFLKVSLQNKAQAAFDEVKAERWQSFLNGKPRPTNGAKPGAKPAVAAAVSGGRQIRVVGVKPPMHEIDHRGTPVNDMAQKIYKLNDGTWIQVRNVN